MADVSDFLKQQQIARNSVETVQRQLRMAYDAAQAGTRQTGDVYDRLDRLSDEHVRIAFKDTLRKGLTAPYSAAITAMPDDPSIAEALVLGGALGFGPNETNGIADSLKDKMTYDAFSKVLAENTDYSKSLERRLATPGSILDQVSATKVANYVGLAVPSPDKMTLQGKAKLIQTFEQLGMIPPKVIKDEPFMKL